MGVLVNTKNEPGEKVLLAFLNCPRYNYQSNLKKTPIKSMLPLLSSITVK